MKAHFIPWFALCSGLSACAHGVAEDHGNREDAGAKDSDSGDSIEGEACADEGSTKSCGTNVGVCRFGANTCKGGFWSGCEGGQEPAAEEDCGNGEDDDCDGTVDNGCVCVEDGAMRSCGVATGACTPGVQRCTTGKWGACEGNVAAVAEDCDNGLDDDCDGSTNEGCDCASGALRPCGTDVGACESGIQRCEDEAWSDCDGLLPVGEICDDRDNDCDGAIDEACLCDAGDLRSCGLAVGECEPGGQSCDDGAWSDCEGAVGPSDEICDTAQDEDCDGSIDEGCECTADEGRVCGSPVGACTEGVQGCEGGLWSECEDAVKPREETCNGVDDDCDGSVDDGCACTEGAVRPCGTGVGECDEGEQLCSGGVWGLCEDEVVAVDEICDNQLDDDCDGSVDEGCSCTPDDTRTCGTEAGACVQGVQTCGAGLWSDCEEGQRPTDELCDGLDNDCDGSADEGCECVADRACGTGTGECGFGVQACVAGLWAECDDDVMPSSETCNGLDDDCDGVVDPGCECEEDDVPRLCGLSNVGACELGAQSCVGGFWGDCAGDVVATGETCNGLDDDCDGWTDPDCTCTDGAKQDCGSEVGACLFGAQTCTGGVWPPCVGGMGPRPELCDGDVDEDCDGAIDNGCECTDNDSRPCGISVGACSMGLQTCESGVWGHCVGAIVPEREIDNDLDDDCDGAIDEDYGCGDADTARGCGIGVGACGFGTQTCEAGEWSDCEGDGEPGAETCNNVDDDCDGTIDEGVDCDCEASDLARSCGINTGACVSGTQSCVGGLWSDCVDEVAPVAERCNGVDDDCDGVADEICPCGAGETTRACGTNVGECNFGTQSCVGGFWAKCFEGRRPSPEVCNGLDDDCDGEIDVGCVCAESAERECGVATGVCEYGRQGCDAGLWGACEGEVGPVRETCNGVDDDCDGEVDVGCACAPDGAEFYSCGSDIGACERGTHVCSGGMLGACNDVRPVAEIEGNGIDDDCDGFVDDEEETEPCWSYETFASGDFGCNDVVVDAEGGVHIAYSNDLDGIYYAFRSPEGLWTTEAVYTGTVTSYSCAVIALRPGTVDDVHVAYVPFADELIYAHRPASGTWEYESVDGFFGGSPLSVYSIAVHLLSGIHILYEGSDFGIEVRYANRDLLESVDDWTLETVDSIGGHVAEGHNSMVLSETGGPTVAYCVQPTFSDCDLHYATHVSPGVWNVETVEEDGDAGLANSIVIASDGAPHILYTKQTAAGSSIRHAAWLGTGAWLIEDVVSSGGADSVTLEYDIYGTAKIAYSTWSSVNYGYRQPSGVWVIEMVDVPGGFSTMGLLPTGSATPYIAYIDNSIASPEDETMDRKLAFPCVP